MMANCPKCGARIEKDDLFCPDCGAKMLHKEKKAPKEAKKEKPAKKEAPKGKLLREKVITFPKPKKVAHKAPETKSYFGRMRERLPAMHPKEQVQKVQPPKSSGGKVFWTIVAIVVVVLLARSCIKSSEPKSTYQYVPVEPEPVKPEPPPPIAEEVVKAKPEIDKSEACSGVSAKIADACWSCGLVSCGLVVTVENVGKKPIFRFAAKSYTNAKDFDESEEWEPLDAGAEGEYYPYTSGTDTRMLEFVPIVLAGEEEVACKGNIAKFGSAYGDGFGECGGGDWRNY